jgi:glyoxylase-like metal-dependent hydrolase (beta-lactamase superfamily II)
MTEADLADLGVYRIPIPIPFPQAGGPVNVYLVEEAGGGVLLWDAGLGTPEAEAALEAGFRRLGRSFSDVRRILISHGHVDHAGAARFVQERSGGEVPVYGHPADAGKYATGGTTWREQASLYSEHLARLGVPREGIERSRLEGDRYMVSGRVAEVRQIGEGEVIRARHLELEVLHVPGHTPGLLNLHAPAQGLLFSADHLLEKVSPNPLIELGPHGEEGFFRPLVAYLSSIARVRALELALILPGHAEPFSGHRPVIDRLVEFYGVRQRRIRAFLDGGPRTAWEVARELFPKAQVAQTFLVISETLANLEVLEARGEVRRTDEDGVWRFGSRFG